MKYYNQYIDELILNGALEFSGIDTETGEILYNFTEKLQQFDPVLYKDFQQHFSRQTAYLWENGFISMDVTEKNPIITLTSKSFDPNAVEQLDSDIKYSLKEIIRLLS